MPIDFAAVAARFDEPLRAQTKPIALLFDVLGRRLTQWAKQVREAERAASTLPLLRYDGDAVTIRLVQTRRVERFDVGARFESAALTFAGGVRQVAVMVEQERLIPRALGVGADVAARLEGRTTRVLRLDPSIFAATDASVFDLPAVLVLGTRAVADAGLLPGGNRASGAPGTPGASSAAAGGGAVAAALQGDPERLVDMVVGVAVGVALVLPVATTLISGHARALSATGRVLVLDALVGAEAELLGFRGLVLEQLYDAADAATILEFWVEPFASLVRTDLLIITTALPLVAEHLLRNVSTTVESINEVSEILVPILDVVFDIWDFITGWDLLPGVPGVSFTIGDAIDAVAFETARNQARQAAALLAILSVHPLLPDRDKRIFFHLGQMLAILGVHWVGTLSGPPIPTVVTRMPDVVARLIPPNLDQPLSYFLRQAGVNLTTAISGALTETSAMATALGFAVDKVAEATVPGIEGLVAAEQSAARWTDQALGSEIERERTAAAERAEAGADDPVLRMITVGIGVAGGLVPHYIAGLRRFLSRREVRPTPVSPHVLQRHGRLAGVHTERLSARLAPADLDREAADATAELLRTGVQRLYADGRQALDRATAELASTGPGGGAPRGGGR